MKMMFFFEDNVKAEEELSTLLNIADRFLSDQDFKVNQGLQREGKKELHEDFKDGNINQKGEDHEEVLRDWNVLKDGKSCHSCKFISYFTSTMAWKGKRASWKFKREFKTNVHKSITPPRNLILWIFSKNLVCSQITHPSAIFHLTL